MQRLFQSVGGELEGYYFGVGQSEIYLLGTVPDLDKLQAVNFAVLSSGVVASMETILLTTAEETQTISKSLSDLPYLPPRAA